MCILFPTRDKPGSSPGVLVTSSYKFNYTKALGKDGILTSHDKSPMHLQSAEQADLFIQNYRNPEKRVDSQLLRKKETQAEENKEVLRLIVLAVEFLAKQGLPFRGNYEDKVDFSCENINRGNFIATLQLMAKGNQVLKRHLATAKANSKYTSKTIQNEIINIYASKIKEKITKQIREENLPFTIIADEGSDSHSNLEILAVCLRYVDTSTPKDPHIREVLLNFVYLERTNAIMIHQKILESLLDPAVRLNPDSIRGQAYDGAAVMSSELAGVQAKIKEVSPLALYIHCYSHCLNLSVAASCKVAEVRNLIGIINEAYLFLANSPKRQKMFELALEVYLPGCSRSKLPGLCKTRWVERHICFEVFYEMYEVLLIFLEAIVSPRDYPDLESSVGSWNWDRDTVVKAQGLKAVLSSFQTVAVFIITKNILDEVKVLAIKLQKQDQDIFTAYKMVDDVAQTIKEARKDIDHTFPQWYEEITQLSQKLDVPESVPRKVGRQTHRNNIPSTSPQDHYTKTIAIPLLDSLITQLDERFSTEGKNAYSLLCLVPSIIASEGLILTEKIDDPLYWERDLPFPQSLGNELRRWQKLWQRQKDNIPDNLLSSLSSCDKDTFPNIYQLLLTACTLPITSAEAERSFSLMRKIRHYNRSTMSEERMASLGVLAMHYGERIAVDEICNAFIQAHPRRLFEASLFQ